MKRKLVLMGLCVAAVCGLALGTLSGAVSAAVNSTNCAEDLSCNDWSCNSYDECDKIYFTGRAGAQCKVGEYGEIPVTDGSECGQLQSATLGQCLTAVGSCGGTAQTGTNCKKI